MRMASPIHFMAAFISRCAQQRRRMRLSDKGTTAMEFALVAPVLFLFIIGIIELSLIMFTWSVLEGATNIGARTGKTDYYTGASREGYIRNEVAELSGGFLDPKLLTLNITSFTDFSQFSYANHNDVANTTPCTPPYTPQCPQGGVRPLGTQNNAGSGGQTVLYTITYPWPLFTPLMAAVFGPVNITAIAAVKNEPFPN